MGLFARGDTSSDTCIALHEEGCLRKVVNECGRMVRVETGSRAVPTRLSGWIRRVRVSSAGISTTLSTLSTAHLHQVLTYQHWLWIRNIGTGSRSSLTGSSYPHCYCGSLEASGLGSGTILEELLYHRVSMMTATILLLL